MENYLPYLKWLDGQKKAMIKLLEEWSNINTHSLNLPGLATFVNVITPTFAQLQAPMEQISLNPFETVDSQGHLYQAPLGKALLIKKRSEALFQVFLGGHMDTVYSKESTFQITSFVNDTTLKGPGVADMKGGLIVMLYALLAFERSPFASKLGWEIFINPDEEIGSPGSFLHLEKCASRCHIALLYEPSLPDGALVSSRKGSAKFTLVVRGRSAHAGRDYNLGRSSIRALAKYILKAEELNDSSKGIIVNVGKIEGGEAVNIVPSLAIARIDVRTNTKEAIEDVHQKLITLTQDIYPEGITLKLHGGITRPPKVFDVASEIMYQQIKSCALTLGLPISWRESGGVCDGNIFAAALKPTVDSLGVLGGEIHTPNEYVLIDSLVQRAKLSALFLMKLGSGEIKMREDTYA